MNERMEQEINRTIALLQASMPQRKSEAALSQLLNIAKSEMNPLLLLALFALLTALVVLSVLRLFCHDPSRCLYAARNCNQSFWDGAKKTGGVHELGIGASMRGSFVSRLCICALENPSRAHVMLSMG